MVALLKVTGIIFTPKNLIAAVDFGGFPYLVVSLSGCLWLGVRSVKIHLQSIADNFG